MKILLCDLLLLSIFSSVFSSCQRDCLTCREKLRPVPDSFNLEVCILECEEKVFPSPLWTPCAKVTARGSWQLSPADRDHAAAALRQPGAPEMQHLKRMPRVGSLFPAQDETGPGPEESGEMETQQKQLQKRFGGFTGARKSARKLANQKRFSEFMRQYLVLSMQSSQRRRTLHQNGNV
ncbi:prepronociceptin isoform 1 preproprotein [Daubentonia madagascariensis]|uniref:Prepronociceptin isoform 1 preproprotein n=3 Tax=Daubentonia madagascariensis TaxID=31869 RepID=A0ABD2D4I4_DAUMA